MSIVRLLALVLVGSCGSTTHVVKGKEPPERDDLDVLTVLKFTGTFRPSGVAGASDCAIYLLARQWGTLARIEATGTVSAVTAHIPGRQNLGSLETGPDGTILVWAAWPAYLAVLHSDLTLESVAIPHHAWGGRWVGPVVPLPNQLIAMSPISNRRFPLPNPTPWLDASLITVLDRSGTAQADLDLLAPEGGRYLTWLVNRAAIGAQGDTIILVRLSSARVNMYASSGDVLAYEDALGFTLPLYFAAPKPIEKIAETPWVTEGRHGFLHVELSHIETAAVGSGRLYAIRNYEAEWLPTGDQVFFDVDGVWNVTQRGLEVYSLQGERLAALDLPHNASWLRVDMNGRIFLGVGDSLIVARDPTQIDSGCPAMPRRIDVHLADEPS